MSEYISKQEAIEAFSDMSDGTPITHGDMISDTTAVNVIKSIPSADVRENIHGHWIEQIDHEENCRTLICSNCDRPALHDEDSIWKHKFCPHCGADMREPIGEKTKDGIQI